MSEIKILLPKCSTESETQFVSWFPEIDKLIFKHFNILSITIKVKDPAHRGTTTLKYTSHNAEVNPLRNYRS